MQCKIFLSVINCVCVCVYIYIHIYIYIYVLDEVYKCTMFWDLYTSGLLLQLLLGIPIFRNEIKCCCRDNRPELVGTSIGFIVLWDPSFVLF